MTNPYSPPAPHAGPDVAYPPPRPGAWVGDRAVEMLRLTRPWVMLISVLCFIGAGFMLIAAAGMALVGVLGSSEMSKGSPFPMGLLGLIYLPLAGIYIYPGVKLWQYAGAIATLVASRSPADLENALLQQKSFWKYSGIAAITIAALYIVVILGAVIVGIATAAGAH